jgi:hypothetical protein
MVAFYADDGELLARCPGWLQSSFDVLVGLFECVGLCTNAKKTKVITCIPGKIRVSLSKEVYNDNCCRAFTHAARKCRWVEYNICGQHMQAAFLQHHLEMQHNVYHSFILNRDLEGGRLPVTFQAEEDTKTGLYCCPVLSTGLLWRCAHPLHSPLTFCVPTSPGFSGYPSGGVVPLPKTP